METCLWAYDGPVQSVVGVRSHMLLLRPEDVKDSDLSGHVNHARPVFKELLTLILGQPPRAHSMLVTMQLRRGQPPQGHSMSSLGETPRRESLS